MQNDPSTALSKLNDIDVSEFQDSATMAHWAILYSEAMVVNKLSVPNDTIINIAIEYYGRHNLTAEFNRASRLKELMHLSTDSDDLATALYLQKEKEFLLYKERAKRELYILVGCVILLIAVTIIVWMRLRLRMQLIQNDMLIVEASGLKSKIDAAHCDIRRLKTKLHEQLDGRFALIDSLCQTYYESQGTKAERNAIISKVKSEIDAVRADSFPEMEQAVNDCLGNILVNVKETCPDIKVVDYQLLVYIASGLSTRTISLLLGESVDVIYKRKSRLKCRLKESVVPVCPDIMAAF